VGRLFGVRIYTPNPKGTVMCKRYLIIILLVLLFLSMGAPSAVAEGAMGPRFLKGSNYAYYYRSIGFAAVQVFADVFIEARQISPTSIYVERVGTCLQVRTNDISVSGFGYRGHLTYIYHEVYVAGRQVESHVLVPNGADITGYMPCDMRFNIETSYGASVAVRHKFHIEGQIEVTAGIKGFRVGVRVDSFTIDDELTIAVWVNYLERRGSDASPSSNIRAAPSPNQGNGKSANDNKIEKEEMQGEQKNKDVKVLPSPNVKQPSNKKYMKVIMPKKR